MRVHPHVTSWIAAVLGVAVIAVAIACTVNPATGERQLTLIGEQQEIAMGRDYDRQLQDQLGMVDDPELTAYVESVGRKLAADSERPDLPWQFRVVDDPTVNAFAVPGGFVYVTRGILAHFNSEAQLAAVLGHEIGHVTARHSVEQMSRAQLATLGLGVAAVASEEFRDYAGLASAAMQVLFLKFSRDDERQADDLGLRYMTRDGYDPKEMADVFEMLDRQSQLAGGQRLPAWQSTHPAPGRREARIRSEIDQLPTGERDGRVERDDYLRRIDGIVFGQDPRQGYVVGHTFYHPGLAFRLDFPPEWNIINQHQAVIGVSPEQDAVVTLTLAEEASTGAAANQFFGQQGVEQGRTWRQPFSFFSVAGDEAAGRPDLRGLVGFIQHRGRVFRLIAYAAADDWRQYDGPASRSLTSFDALTDRRYLDVEPARIELVRVPATMTLAELQRRSPSTVELAELAVLNGVTEDARLPAGTLVKRVVGGDLPGH